MNAQPRISSYAFGRIVIDGQTYTSDVVVLPAGVKSNWWREEGHTLKPADLSAVLEVSPRVLVVGKGAYGLMKVADETLACLESADIEAICVPTSQAVEVYNERSQRGDLVAAALHLTC